MAIQGNFSSALPAPSVGYAQIEGVFLYYRVIGQGQPVIALHGGPDFDHSYLVPDLDRLAQSLHLIYYDQRGRGKSGENIQPEQVSLQSEIKDLDGLRAYFHLDPVTLLGHSWGGLLAMEYAVRYPQRVSHLILLNSAPASHADLMRLRQERQQAMRKDLEKLRMLTSSVRYESGDLAADAEYHRIHFQAALHQPEHLERVVQTLRVNVTPEGIRKARAIEQRLYAETWLLEGYSLFPRLAQLKIPTLVIHGAQDIVPVACADHIAQTIPQARFVVLNECGHFSFLERPAEVHQEITAFFEESGSRAESD